MRISYYAIDYDSNGRIERGRFVVRSCDNFTTKQATIRLGYNVHRPCVSTEKFRRLPPIGGWGPLVESEALWQELRVGLLLESRNYKTKQGLKIALKRSFRKLLLKD